jgi:hypothetical protein
LLHWYKSTKTDEAGGTGSVHPFMEHLMYTANFAIPLVGTWLAGNADGRFVFKHQLKRLSKAE